MAERELTDEEARALGLHERELSDQEVAALGLGPSPAPASPTAAAPQVSGKETLLSRAVDALPLGRLSTNLPATLALQAVKAIGPDWARRGIPGPMDTYRDVRDTATARGIAGGQQNPLQAGIGTGLGTILALAAPLPKASVGGGAGGRVLSNALTAGGYGALNGAMGSQGDLTRGDVGQFLGDALGVGGLQRAYQDAKAGNYGHAVLDTMGAGGLGGMATGGALAGLMEGGRAVLSPLAGALKAKALDAGRKVLTNGADQLSKRAPISDPAVEETIRSGAMPAFSNTKSVLGRLNNLTDEVGDQYGKVVADLEAKGVRGPDARTVADQLLKTGAGLERNTMNNALPAEYLNQAENLLGKAGPQGELGLTQAESLKRSLQKMAKYGRVEDTEINEVRKGIASTLRQANEDAIDAAARAAPQDTQLQGLASSFVPVKQRLGALLEAESAATRGAARGAQRGHFGLADIAHSAGAVASGHPALAPVVALASGLVRNRLPSAVASGGLSLADFLRGSASTAAPRSGYAVEELLQALRQPQGMAPALAGGPDDEQGQLAAALRGGP